MGAAAAAEGWERWRHGTTRRWWARLGSRERTTTAASATQGSGLGARTASGQPPRARLGAVASGLGRTEGLSRKPVKSLGELKYMRTLSRRTNLARVRVRVAAVSAHRRLAARRDA